MTFAATLPFCIAPAGAHHSYAAYDLQKNVTIEGIVKEVQRTTPHIWIQVLTKDPSSGAEVEWSVQGGLSHVAQTLGRSEAALRQSVKLHFNYP